MIVAVWIYSDKMKILIEFNSVFDAARGIELMNTYKSVQDKYTRDHDYGSLKFKINRLDYYILKENNVGFKKLKEQKRNEV